jgi:hypothetical protein
MNAHRNHHKNEDAQFEIISSVQKKILTELLKKFALKYTIESSLLLI